MKPKKIIILVLFLCVLGFIYYFYIPGKRFPKVKTLLVQNSGLGNNSGADKYVVIDSVKWRVIDDPVYIERINKIRRIRMVSIVKRKMPGKVITVNNDTIDISISLPGGYIYNKQDERTYGFVNSKKQKKILEIFY